MPDPLELLSHFDPEPARALPPSEVRRRGDRRRRRRAGGLVAAAVVVATVAVVTPLAVLGGGGDGRSAPPADTRVDGWLQRIPAGFPLAAGLDGVGPPTRPADGVAACTSLAPARDAVDSVEVHGAHNGRFVEVLPDSTAAHAAVRDLRRRLTGCAAAPMSAALGDEAFVLTSSRSADHGDSSAQPGTSVEVVRVGNAVTVTALGDPGYADAAGLMSRSADVVAAMKVFAASSPAVPTIPATFPLASGLPVRQPGVPTTVVPFTDADVPRDLVDDVGPLAREAGTPGRLAVAVLMMRRGDEYDRALVVLPSEDDATRLFQRIEGRVARLGHRPPSSRGPVTVVTPVAAHLGDRSEVVRIVIDPGGFSSTLEVVQEGHAVYLSLAAGDRDRIRRPLAGTAAIVGAMTALPTPH